MDDTITELQSIKSFLESKIDFYTKKTSNSGLSNFFCNSSIAAYETMLDHVKKRITEFGKR